MSVSTDPQRRLMLAALLVLVLLVPSVTAQEQPVVRAVTPPAAVTPQVLNIDLRELTRTAPVKLWQPGDPVRIIDDLKGKEQPPPVPSTPPTTPTTTGSMVPPASTTGQTGQPTPANTTDIDLRELPPSPQWKPGDPVREIPDLREVPQRPPTPSIPTTTETPAMDAMAIPVTPQEVLAPAPVMGASFDGIPATGFLPPDTNGDVGPNHYVQTVNVSLAIYNKSGTLLAGPVAINSLWSGFGGPCQSQNNGDPIVRYDQLANRWMVSQFALAGNPNYQCIAVSKTADPVAGGWYLYAFPMTDGATNIFPDYPKIGVWPDGYYMGTQRGFPSSGLDVWAFERVKMLAGQPAQLVHFALPGTSLFLLPSDLDGTSPPAGTPNFFVRQIDGNVFGGADRLEVWSFTVNWVGATGTFVLTATLPTAPFDSVLCGGGLIGTCVPQPGTTQRLETLTVWAMWRAQYRNFGSYQTLVLNHTVDANGADLAGVRWYELRRPSGGPWAIFQQGTYAPDATHRWMGSTAMDKAGNIAQGFSVSSATVFPGIRAALRSPGDPAGTLPTEITIVNGGGSQTSGSSRWGNYSSMDVDPTDDCTFWYTTEYYTTTSTAGWRTRIASFKIPSCTAVPGTWVITNKAVPNFPIWATAACAKPQTGDFNGDGKQDIVLTGVSGWATLPVAFSNGDGSFNVTNAAAGSFPAWAASTSSKTLLGDYNGDGKTDLAITGPNGWGSVPVAFSNGNGTFNVVNAPIANFAAWAATSNAKPLLGDFNGDGRTDIALTGPNAWGSLPVAFSNGNGTFNVTNAAIVNFAAWAATANAEPLTGDFNGDGKADIALAGVNAWGSMPVAFSNGNGTFNVTNAAVGSFAAWAATANATRIARDFNGDGKTDVALTGPNGWTTLPVAFSNGNGTFNVTNAAIVNFAGWAALTNVKALGGRYNSGKSSDIALTGASGWGTIPVAFSNNNGTFNVTNGAAPGFAVWAATTGAIPLQADFNGDGRTDIALTGPTAWSTIPVAFSVSP